MLRMAWPGSAPLAAAHAAVHHSRGSTRWRRAAPLGPERSALAYLGTEEPAAAALRCLAQSRRSHRLRPPISPPSAAQATSPTRRPRTWPLSSVRSSTCPAQAACGKRHSLGLLAAAQLATPRSPEAGTVGSGRRSTHWRSDRAAQGPVGGRGTSSDADAFTHLQARAPISTARSSCRSQTSPTTTSSAGSASAASARV